jgi:hypothetical protein
MTQAVLPSIGSTTAAELFFNAWNSWFAPGQIHNPFAFPLPSWDTLMLAGAVISLPLDHPPHEEDLVEPTCFCS